MRRKRYKRLIRKKRKRAEDRAIAKVARSIQKMEDARFIELIKKYGPILESDETSMEVVERIFSS